MNDVGVTPGYHFGGFRGGPEDRDVRERFMQEHSYEPRAARWERRGEIAETQPDAVQHAGQVPPATQSW